MRTPRAFAMAASAALVLAIAATGASANRLRISEQNFVITWSTLEFDAASHVVRCPVTLAGHFVESTIAKSRESQAASITRAAIGSCTGGTATVLAETVPWSVYYSSFEGTLPNISGIADTIVGARMQFRSEGSIECLAGTTASFPWKWIKKFIIVGGVVIQLIDAIRSAEIPLGGGFACSLAGNAHISGEGRIANLPGTASISVTLI